MSKHEHYFYDKPIFPEHEREYIQKLLSKYKGEEAGEELKEKIWNDLQTEKHLGNISIPFKIVLKKDEYGRYPDSVEIILDTKL